MKNRNRVYTPGYLPGGYVICYEEGGRTWNLRDNDGKSYVFATPEETQTRINKGDLPHQAHVHGHPYDPGCPRCEDLMDEAREV